MVNKNAWWTARAAMALMVLGIPAAFAAPCGDGKPPSPLMFCSDFESGVLSDRQWNTSGNAPVITTEHPRTGKYALKSVLNRATSKKWYRTEVSNDLANYNTKPGGEYWYGFSIYLPSDYVSDDIWEIVAQFHNIPDTAKGEAQDLNPPVSLHTKGGVWTLSTIWDSRVLTNSKTYEGKKSYALGEYAKGKWTDWVFHVIWSPTSKGLLEVWKDGKQVIDTPGPIAFNDSVGPYLKLGIYKGWTTRTEPVGKVSQRTVFHDEVRIAGSDGSFAAVSPGSSSPSGSTTVKPSPPTSIKLEPGS